MNIKQIISKKSKNEKIVALTAYDYQMAKILDSCGVDILLVGDSLGNVILGHKTTLPVTIEASLLFTQAVTRATEHALVVGDMPFLSYQCAEDEAVKNAGRFLSEGGAGAVKLEGGSPRVARLVERLVETGIPVMGHLGLTPQSYFQMGGYRKQATDSKAQEKLKEEALRLEEAGVFALVLECIPFEFAEELSQTLQIPTIGIGSGDKTDGQILVVNDLLGLSASEPPKFVRPKLNLKNQIETAVLGYVSEVKSNQPPLEKEKAPQKKSSGYLEGISL